MSPIAMWPLERDVVRELVEQRRLRPVERVLVGDDRFEHLDVLVDELERVLGDVAVLGDDQRDRIADVAHLVGRQTVDRGRLQARHHVHADRPRPPAAGSVSRARSAPV